MSDNIYKDYANLRKSIGKLQKSGENPHFKNTYVELNTALQVVDDNINDHSFICFIQTPINIDGKNYLNTKLVHESGEIIEGNLELITTRQDPQMLGSSLTYARRYSLLTILGLQAVDDDGNEASGKEPKKKEVKKKDSIDDRAKKLITFIKANKFETLSSEAMKKNMSEVIGLLKKDKKETKAIEIEKELEVKGITL